MAVGNTSIHEWSLGTSLLLKSGVLGLGLVAVLWVGWPQLPSLDDNRTSSVLVVDQLTASQRSTSPMTRESSIVTSPLSAGEITAKDLKDLDRELLIDLNLGSRREIETLPGIGRTLADRIVSYRSIHGSFQHIDELVKVSGIGPKRFQRLQPFVTVNARMDKRAT